MRDAPLSVFVRRRERDWCAVLVKHSADDLGSTDSVDGGGGVVPRRRDADASAWYRAISRRVGTSGRATGIVPFENGNAIAVLIEEQKSAQDNDVVLIATTRFMKASTFDPNAWGPSLRGAENVNTHKVCPHEGISAFDVVKKLAPNSKTGPGTIQL